MSKKMPCFFISHGGGPCFWIDWGPVDPFAGLGKYLRAFAKNLGRVPKAILVNSAHWEESEFTIQTALQPKMLYDYSGFPPHTYQLKYPAAGSPWVVDRVKELFAKNSIPLHENAERGYDHGLFVPFLLMYPEANIPILQLSLKRNLDPKDHLRAGEALAPLRDEDVLIVGSGYSYHNLRRFFGGGAEAPSKTFDDWLFKTMSNSDFQEREKSLIHWAGAPAAREAHPREDHLLPLMVAAGAGHTDAATRDYSEKAPGLNIQTSGFRFG